MRIRFVSTAHHDVTEAAELYTKADPELGNRFFEDLDYTLGLIVQNPRIGHLTERGALRFSLRRFPYDVIYRLRPEEIVVDAIAHHRRDPSYWVSRLD